MNYKIVALDIDGTLLDSKGQISQKNIEMIHRLRKAGIQVILATGRYYMQTERIINTLGFDGILVSNDGAVTIKADTKQILSEYYFAIEDVAHTIRYCREKKIHFSICTAFDYYVETMDDFQREQCERYETTYTMVEDVFALNQKVMKFTVSDNHFTNGWQQFEYPEHLRKRADAEHFKEIVHRDTYKTNAIKNVLALLDLQSSDMIAIGDYHNDIDMIEFAGMGIAMENAPDEVKSKANDVTLSNDEDGVYYALEKYLC